MLKYDYCVSERWGGGEKGAGERGGGGFAHETPPQALSAAPTAFAWSSAFMSSTLYTV